MNFLPLCTAMVWPIMSGTIVERRDQVFTTFFSLRVFSPSTFSRRCPSTNGPFLSERAISLLFLHAAQTAPLGMPHLLKSAYRTRHTMRFRAERANKPRTQRIRRTVHDHRPSRLAQLVQHRFERHHLLSHCQDRLGRRLRRHPLRHTLARPLRACAYRCPASCCTAGSCCCPSRQCHCLCSPFATFTSLPASRMICCCCPELLQRYFR